MPICHVHLRGQRPEPRRGTAKEPRTLGIWIWSRRKALRLRQQDLAERLVVRTETIQRWERDHQRPSPKRMAEIRKVLGNPPEEILEIWMVRRAQERPRRPPTSAPPEKVLTIGDHIRKRRLELGLLQREAANEIGVHETTLRLWEWKRTSPRVRHLPRVIEFLGYLPDADDTSFPDQLRLARAVFGFSQEEMAGWVAVDPSTWWRWEQGLGAPTEWRSGAVQKVVEAAAAKLRSLGVTEPERAG